MYHPHQPGKSLSVGPFRKDSLLRKVMEKGRIIRDIKKPAEIAEYVNARLLQLPEEHKRFENPHIYKVGISKKLMDLRSGIIDEIRRKYKP
jgi:nicotinate phosphoribosyltransferase